MLNSKLLLIDAGINFFLGFVLLAYSERTVKFFGLPPSSTAFYPMIMGAVFVGIAIALVMEYRRKDSSLVGLGKEGAAAINLCGGAVLLLWLIFGNLVIPTRGLVILWVLAIVLVVLSSFEIFFSRDKKV